MSKRKVTISVSDDLLENIDRERQIASRSAFIERELRRTFKPDSANVDLRRGEPRER
jgi:metal-responsive CopG/Arc/MetJ family transcriptional regulator